MGRMLTAYAVAQRHSEPQQHGLFVPGRTQAAPCSSVRDSSLHLSLTVSPAFWPARKGSIQSCGRGAHVSASPWQPAQTGELSLWEPGAGTR